MRLHTLLSCERLCDIARLHSTKHPSFCTPSFPTIAPNTVSMPPDATIGLVSAALLSATFANDPQPSFFTLETPMPSYCYHYRFNPARRRDFDLVVILGNKTTRLLEHTGALFLVGAMATRATQRCRPSNAEQRRSRRDLGRCRGCRRRGATGSSIPPLARLRSAGRQRLFD